MTRVQLKPSSNVKSAVDLRCRTSKNESEEILQDEVKRLSCKVAELNAQAMNEGKAVREMDSLHSEVQRLTDKLRQAVADKNVAEARAAQEERAAKEAMSQRDAAVRAQSLSKLEAERANALVSNLNVKIKELQHQESEDWLQRTVLQRQIDTQAEEMRSLANVQSMLDEERRCREKLECQLAEQQNLVAALREEFHARLLGDKERIAALGQNSGLLDEKQQLSDDESVEAFGEVLKKLIVAKSASEAQKVKRQLLFCFHPDKNPATDIATRITQILTSADLGEAAGQGAKSSGSHRKTRPQPRASSPMHPGPRYSSSYSSQHVPQAGERPQSARPRCRV